MKVQKGIVKYKDRSDIECLYGIMDDGSQYYFLDNTGKTLSNGNIIASTALVEAIDPMYESKQIGLIDGQGNVVIPFENKSIKSVNDGIILVEKADPTSQSVIDACNLRNDPLSATKLVSTPATIKSNLSTAMGGEGRYIFNDQFSEATICDVNGNNLVNGEFYSFIAMANNKLYFSKNTVDSPIMEYALLANAAVDVPPVAGEGAIDVGSVSVDPQQVNDAMASQENVVATPTDSSVPVAGSEMPVDNGENNVVEENSTISVPVGLGTEGTIVDGAADSSVPVDAQENAAVEGDVSDATVENGDTVSIDSQDDIMAATSSDDIPTDAAEQEDEAPADEATEDTQADEVQSGEKSDDIDTASDDVEAEADAVEDNVDDGQEVIGEAAIDSEEDDVVEDTKDEEKAEDDSKDVTEAKEDDKELELNIGKEESIDTDNLVDEVVDGKDGDEVTDTTDASASAEDKNEPVQNFDSIFESDMNDDIFKDSVVNADSITDIADSYTPSYDINSSSSNIANDIIASMNRLIKQNKAQKAEIVSFETQKRQLAEKYREQSDKIKNLSEVAGKLHSRNQLLESKVHEQIKVISAREREIKELRAQLKGFKDLAKLSTAARELLDSNYSSYDYEDDSSYYRMAA